MNLAAAGAQSFALAGRLDTVLTERRLRVGHAALATLRTAWRVVGDLLYVTAVRQGPTSVGPQAGESRLMRMRAFIIGVSWLWILAQTSSGHGGKLRIRKIAVVNGHPVWHTPWTSVERHLCTIAVHLLPAHRRSGTQHARRGAERLALQPAHNTQSLERGTAVVHTERMSRELSLCPCRVNTAVTRSGGGRPHRRQRFSAPATLSFRVLLRVPVALQTAAQALHARRLRRGDARTRGCTFLLITA